MTTKTPISTQKAYDVGKSGGNVKTTGMPYQQKQRIDAAVNKGKQGK